MAEYFEKDGLLLRLEDRQAALVNGWGPRDHYTRGFEEAVDMVRDHPAADAAPVVYSRWILHTTATGQQYTECANCCTDFSCRVAGKGPLTRIDMRGVHYCPYCGAKMDKTGGGR